MYTLVLFLFVDVARPLRLLGNAAASANYAHWSVSAVCQRDVPFAYGSSGVLNMLLSPAMP